MRRVLAGLVPLVLLLTACDLPWQKEEATVPAGPTTFPAPDPAKDSAIAQQIALTPEDMGEAWKVDTDTGGTGVDTFADDPIGPIGLWNPIFPICQQIRDDVRFQRELKEVSDGQQTMGTADGKWLMQGTGVFKRGIVSQVTLYKDPALITKNLALQNDERAVRCSKESLQRQSLFDFPPTPKYEPRTEVLGGDGVGYRMIGTSTLNGQVVNAYADTLYIQADRALMAVTFMRFNAEPLDSFEQEVLAKLRAKASKAMAAQPPAA